MKLKFEASFHRDIKRVKDKLVLDKAFEIVKSLKYADSFHEIPNLKKLKAHPNAYSIRIGGFRLGLFLEKDTLILSRLLNRKDIYKKFP